MRTRVKICGIRSVEDAYTAIEHGADALGFNFWPPGSRYISPADAGDIIRQLPPLVATVAVVVEPSGDELADIVAHTQVDMVQFHGDESTAFCESAPRPYIKAIRVQSSGDVTRAGQAHPRARAFLMDAYKKGLPGGTGESFDWALIPSGFTRPTILAGGLNPENVGRAIEAVRPFAVDVSSGVEASPGVKDPGKVQKFLSEVKRVAATQ